MSLNDFLRDGGEAPYRIMNRLSQLIQNLDITGLAPTFPFSPSSRKNSWRDWEGEIDVTVHWVAGALSFVWCGWGGGGLARFSGWSSSGH